MSSTFHQRRQADDRYNYPPVSPTRVPSKTKASLILVVAYTRIRRCVLHPSEPILPGRYIHSWNSGGAEELGVGTVSPRAFRRRIVRYWRPLDCRATELGKPPQVCVVHTVVYGMMRKQARFARFFCHVIYQNQCSTAGRKPPVAHRCDLMSQGQAERASAHALAATWVSIHSRLAVARLSPLIPSSQSPAILAGCSYALEKRERMEPREWPERLQAPPPCF